MRAERLRRAAAVGVAAGRHLAADHALNHAAAVAYFTLLSFVPFLYLVGRGLRRLLPGLYHQDAAISGLIAFLPPAAEAPVRELVASMPRIRGLFAVAVPGLLWVASTAFSSLEVSINVAFGTSQERRFLLSRLKSFAGFFALGLLLAAGIVLHHFASFLESVRERMGLPPALGPTATWVSSVVLVSVTFGGLTILYKSLPRGKVRWGAAATGASVAVVLWEGARRIFGAILGHSPAYGVLTGVLAAVVAFLLWIYVAVLITIYGAEVAAIRNGNRPVAQESAEDGVS